VKKRDHAAQDTVRAIYRTLASAWGPQHWWPAETPFEVIVGAILTQNTSWTNVEKAIANLRTADALGVEKVRALPLLELERLIRPSGYFRQKAARLKQFVAYVDERYAGSVASMLTTPLLPLRTELLALKGIGPETADSILLYAGHHPIFVVDAYTRRVLERHEAIGVNAKYEEIRVLVESALHDVTPAAGGELASNRPTVHTPSAMSMATRGTQAQVFNEVHGLFVQLGKHYCSKSSPKCEVCPLGHLLPLGAAQHKNRVNGTLHRTSRVRKTQRASA